MEKRVFLIVLDSFGIGAEPDAAAFGDEGTNTLGAIANHPNFNCPNLKKLGLFNIDGVTVGEKDAAPIGSFARLQEQSMGKDTTIGHWEIAGVVSPKPLPTFPDGFPDSLIHEFEEKRKKYDFAQPFTKESLLYREIFEKYYPGQAPMVKDFWMPNKSWKGCDVNDPSARVLSNYGESGT